MIGLAGGLFVVATILEERTTVIDTVRQGHLGWLILALVTGLVSMTGIGLAWRRGLLLVGGSATRRQLLHWYFVGQLGKYIPGGIWPVLGRGEMARKDGVPRPTAYSSVVLSLGATYHAAVVLSACLVPIDLASGGRPTRALWVLVFLPLGFLIVHPKLLGLAIGAIERLRKTRVEVTIPRWGSSTRLILRHVPSWLGIGAATWLVAQGLGVQEASLTNVLTATVLSWVVGFIAVPVPGGLGVREAVFVAAASSMSPGVAATIAVTARVVFVIVDASGAAVTTFDRRGHERR